MSFSNSSLNTNKEFELVDKNHMFLHGNIKNINKINTWILKTNYNSVNKPFFRFILKPNLTDLDIKNFLNILIDCSIEYTIGGASIIKIEKILFNFLICKKLNKPINKLNVKEFLKQNTSDEIKSMHIIKKNENLTITTQKYIFHDKEAIYMDIPLLLEFYLYNIGALSKIVEYHNINYILCIPEKKLDLIKKYIDNIVLMFDECIMFNKKTELLMKNNYYEIATMDCHCHFFEKINNNIIKCNLKLCSFSKFIFIIVRNETSSKNNNEINNVTQFPQLTNIEIEKYNHDTKKNETNSIDLSNIWFSQYDDLMIYAVATNCISNMNNWIRVNKECSESIEKFDFSKKINNTITNYNNYEEKFYVECYVKNVKIYFSDSNLKVNVEIVEISQNVLRMMSGMAGKAISS